MEVIGINKSSQVYYEFPDRKHGYWEIIINLEGSGTTEIEGHGYPFAPGTVFCLPPNTLHGKTSTMGFKDGCLFIKDFVPPDGRKILIYEDNSGDIGHLFEIAYEAKKSDAPNASAVVNALADAIYQIMVGQSLILSKRNIQVETFQSILVENIANLSFNVAAEANKMGYSESYFRLLFKERTGYSPANYLIHIRLEHAKSMLRQYHTVMAIKEIAYDSGFNDPYYFSRLFRKYVGVSPREYINSLGDFDYNSLVDRDDPESTKFSKLGG